MSGETAIFARDLRSLGLGDADQLGDDLEADSWGLEDVRLQRSHRHLRPKWFAPKAMRTPVNVKRRRSSAITDNQEVVAEVSGFLENFSDHPPCPSSRDFIQINGDLTLKNYLMFSNRGMWELYSELQNENMLKISRSSFLKILKGLKTFVQPSERVIQTCGCETCEQLKAYAEALSNIGIAIAYNDLAAVVCCDIPYGEDEILKSCWDGLCRTCFRADYAQEKVRRLLEDFNDEAYIRLTEYRAGDFGAEAVEIILDKNSFIQKLGKWLHNGQQGSGSGPRAITHMKMRTRTRDAHKSLKRSACEGKILMITADFGKKTSYFEKARIIQKY